MRLLTIIFLIFSFVLPFKTVTYAETVNTNNNQGQTKEQLSQENKSPVSSADPSNNYIAYEVGDDGRYTIGTTQGDPQNPNDDNKNLLYGFPNPWSSYTTLNIDGNPSIFNPNNGIPVSDATKLTNQSSETLNGLTVTQNLSIVNTANSTAPNTVKISYTVQNNDTVNHQFGIRIMLDTMLGSNDAAPFRVPGVGEVTTETELTGSQVPEYYQAFDSLTNPTIVSQGTVYQNETEKPDKIQFTNWSHAYNTMWDYPVQNGYEIGDSAVSLTWNPKSLAPGQSLTFVTYYGLSTLTQNLQPPLALSITGAQSIDAGSGVYSPNPFTVTAYVGNIGTATAQNVNLTLNLPDGLRLVDGQNQTIHLNNLNVNQEGMASWQVKVDSSSVDRDLTYSVTVKSDNSQSKTVNRNIHIPALVQPNPVLYIHGLGQDSTSLDTGIKSFLNDIDKIPNYHVIGLENKNDLFSYVDTDSSSNTGYTSDANVSPYVDISQKGNSNPNIFPNSEKLHSEINNYYSIYKQKVVLMGYSMGAAIIRGDLYYHPEDANKIKFVVFLNGAQQGSLLPAAGRGVLNTLIEGSDMNNPLTTYLTQKSIDYLLSNAGITLDPYAPALIDLSPQSDWYLTVNQKAPPKSIPYYNFYGDINVSMPYHVLPFNLWTINGPTAHLGDGVLPTGDSNPMATPLLGGAKFYNDNGGQWSETYNYHEDVTFAELLLLNPVGSAAYNSIPTFKDILTSPALHTTVPGKAFSEINADNGNGQSNMDAVLKNIFVGEASK